MHPILNIAIRAARAAGDIILRHIDKLDTLQIETKSQNDFVTEVDRRAEQEALYHIRKAYPDHAILAEESGADGEDENIWIIDPLDGTTNFLRGLNQFAVSIALQQRGQLEHAVVYNPLSQDLFSASRGKGAWLNNRRMRVSKARSLNGCLIGTGVPFKSGQNRSAYFQVLDQMMHNTAGVRRVGAASLDLAWVANGTFDGFFEMGLKPWDIAAGALLVQEAGGMISDYTGGKNWLEQGHIVAAPPRIHVEMLAILAPCTKDLLSPVAPDAR